MLILRVIVMARLPSAFVTAVHARYVSRLTPKTQIDHLAAIRPRRSKKASHLRYFGVRCHFTKTLLAWNEEEHAHRGDQHQRRDRKQSVDETAGRRLHQAEEERACHAREIGQTRNHCDAGNARSYGKQTRRHRPENRQGRDDRGARDSEHRDRKSETVRGERGGTERNCGDYGGSDKVPAALKVLV